MQKQAGLTEEIIEAIRDKKGMKITEIDLSDVVGAPATKLIVCQGRSTSQVSAIADNIRDRVLNNLNLNPWHYEGYRNSQWIVVDYGAITVHIFLPETREFYNLEDLWSDGNITILPDID